MLILKQVIDEHELERILDSIRMAFTKKQILEILSTVDVDNTNTIDFFEYLAVSMTKLLSFANLCFSIAIGSKSLIKTAYSRTPLIKT